jgi:hypothetical protein
MANTKGLTIDAQTFQHSAGAELNLLALKADMARLGEKADKTFRASFMAGVIAAALGVSDSAPATAILSKAAPLPTDADAEKKAARRAKVKAGEITERSKAEQQLYAAAKSKLSYWLAKYGISAAQQRKNDTSKAKLDAARAKQARAVEKDRLAKPSAELTPTANNGATADKFIRQQAAMLLAYCEKNKSLVAHATRDAVAELYEALRAIPQADDEAAE